MSEQDPYAEFKTEPAPDTLKQLADAVLELEEAQSDLARAQSELKAAEKRVADLAEFRIPELMDECGGLEEIKVAGRKLKLAPSYHGSISEERRAAAFAWLREHGHGSIIRNDVVLKFKPGADEDAETFLASLPPDAQEIAEHKEWVHHSTLNAFVKEQLTSGKELPMDTFGAHVRRTAKIKR